MHRYLQVAAGSKQAKETIPRIVNQRFIAPYTRRIYKLTMHNDRDAAEVYKPETSLKTLRMILGDSRMSERTSAATAVVKNGVAD